MSDLEGTNLEERDNALNEEIAKHPAEESIEVLVKDARRRTRQLHILTATVILVIIMLLGLAGVSYKLYQISKLAQSNKAAVVANCETANDSRQNNKALWDFVFALPPDQPPTPEQAQRAAEFKGFVAKTFALRDCQAEINSH
jgi:uncharacterized iron-regulated membrane protein